MTPPHVRAFHPERRSDGYWSARFATAVLLILFGAMLYQLLLGRSNAMHVQRMEQTLKAQHAKNDAAKKRNEQIALEVEELIEGLDGVEAQARESLGMVKPNEILVQIVPTIPATK